nr:MAG TPA: hypothetical protein [Caudoviricetes sp.]
MIKNETSSETSPTLKNEIGQIPISSLLEKWKRQKYVRF